MAKDVKFVRDPAGFEALLNGSEVNAMVTASAQAIASQATSTSLWDGAQFVVEPGQGRSRAFTMVTSGNEAADWSARREKILIRSMGAGRV